ncbi:hypothetical protein GPECTOR_7g1240 [Gonium pectorale]|uniref:C-CAP/cofactor C-like domain-containing protein n=1 Tax=Gonium pectorale TaxID=33097 RepID=A0A150GU04_GONPE|nr:hypothetical protein GPECTOR_7g1240 [Gonium pectorale]|eukprot:KXZ53345.1 hypothetical protein GPECTOR_7g1240 [Gonium pectorale]
MQPRREVWEYGALPLQSLCPQLDGIQTLQSFHGKLFSRSKAGSQGQRLVSPADVSQVLELTTSQTEVLVEILSALSYSTSTDAAATPSAGGPPPPAATPAASGDDLPLHELSLFLLAQLYCREAQRADAVEYWPDPGSSGFAAAAAAGGFGANQELLSPTRRSQPGGRSLTRQQLQSHLRASLMASRGFGDYLRRNLRTCLELVLEAWPPGPASRVSTRELDRLGFVLASRGGGLAQEPLSVAMGLAPPARPLAGVAAPQPAPPMALDAAVSSLRSLWQEESVDSPRLLTLSSSLSASGSLPAALSPSPKFQRAMGMVAPAGQVDDRAVCGVYRGTVVRGEGDLPGGEVRISDCHEAVIYILAPLQAALVSGCSDCTVVLGAVGRLLRVERCDKVQVIAATGRLLVSACHDCSFNVGTPRPPCLIGDNRFIRLGPHNTRYERQVAHAREVGLRCDLPNRFDSPVVLAAKDRKSMSGATPSSPRVGMGVGLATASSIGSAAAAKACFTLQPVDEFLPFVVPFVGGNGPLAGGAAPALASRWSSLAASSQRGSLPGPLYLFPLPPDYERALQRRLGLTHDMRAKFKQAGLTKDKERELNDAIQGYFKEWLVASNLLRQIYDLSTLEKEELAAAASAGATGGPGSLNLSPLPAPAGLG